MKKSRISILIVPIIFLLMAIIFYIYAMRISQENSDDNNILVAEENNGGSDLLFDETETTDNLLPGNNMNVTMDAIILEVHSKSLTVMSVGSESLYSVSIGKQGNIEYKKGQEILVYYDGLVAEIYPALISNVGKIEIIKEQSDITIPEKYLEYYNKPTNNVNVSLLNLSKKGISFLVNSEVEIPFDHSEIYDISINGSYTDGALAGISYNQKLEKKLEISPEDIMITATSIENDDDANFIKYDVDWTNVYGELKELEERKISFFII